jgi:Fe-S-cluster-containing dehydrogenase component
MVPLICQQCAEPECLKVCPTGATTQDENGIVHVDKDLCMGCKYCIMACPYGARQTVEGWQTYFPDADGELDPYETYAKDKWEEKNGYGMATKCDYCMDRIAQSGRRRTATAWPPSATTAWTASHKGASPLVWRPVQQRRATSAISKIPKARFRS